MRAAATESAKKSMKVSEVDVDARWPMTTDAIPRTMKLYGQMIPKTNPGGCHDGLLMLAYQLSPVLTQRPEPMA